MYPPEITVPMENELVSKGFEALKSSKEVDDVIAIREKSRKQLENMFFLF